MEQWCHVKPGTMLYWPAKYLFRVLMRSVAVPAVLHLISMHQEENSTFPCRERLNVSPPVKQTHGICVAPGTEFSAEFSTKYPKTLRTMAYTPGGAQTWQSQDLGSESAYPTITGAIFEFGFSDLILADVGSILLMSLLILIACASHFIVLRQKKLSKAIVFSNAALDSNRQQQVVQLDGEDDQ